MKNGKLIKGRQYNLFTFVGKFLYYAKHKGDTIAIFEPMTEPILYRVNTSEDEADNPKLKEGTVGFEVLEYSGENSGIDDKLAEMIIPENEEVEQ